MRDAFKYYIYLHCVSYEIIEYLALMHARLDVAPFILVHFQ